MGLFDNNDPILNNPKVVAARSQEIFNRTAVNDELFASNPDLAFGLTIGRGTGAATQGLLAASGKGADFESVQPIIEGERRKAAIKRYAQSQGIDPSDAKSMEAFSLAMFEAGFPDVALKGLGIAARAQEQADINTRAAAEQTAQTARTDKIVSSRESEGKARREVDLEIAKIRAAVSKTIRSPRFAKPSRGQKKDFLEIIDEEQEFSGFSTAEKKLFGAAVSQRAAEYTRVVPDMSLEDAQDRAVAEFLASGEFKPGRVGAFGLDIPFHGSASFKRDPKKILEPVADILARESGVDTTLPKALPGEQVFEFPNKPNLVKRDGKYIEVQ